MARFLNDTVTQLVQSAPARFSGLGAVPMQDVDAAIEELDFIMHQAGLSGVEIAGNINGVPIGDSRFAPFFEAAEKWGAAVFVHPLRPVGLDRLIGPPVLEQALAFPGEIGLAAASLVTGGTLARHRGLRIAFSHGGGSLSVLLSRLHHAWESFPQLKETMAVAPRDIARSIYVDSLLYDPRMVEGLVQFFGETRVMVGSDYPFAIMERDPHGAISSLEVDERVKQMLRSENARRWLGMRDTV
jgi:aminocarboxymuconate-semialdehyde decarboxylase